MEQYSIDTIALHGGYKPEPPLAPVMTPIYMTTAYDFGSTETARARFALEDGGHIYTRLSNPTNDVLEQRIAAMDGGAAAVAASSGHAAMTMTFLNLAHQGDEIVSAKNIYGGAINLMTKTFAQMGIKFILVDGSDPENFRRATTDRTRAYFLETQGNPLGDIVDIGAIGAIAHEFGIPVIADNTEATPALMRPIDFGADIVIYSSTKFLCGNGAAMGGLVVDSGKFRWKGNPRFADYNEPDPSYHGVVYADLGEAAFALKLRAHILRDIGACQSPFNAWLTLLGMETLSLRMERHSKNGLALAKWLAARKDIESVSHPELEGSPSKPLADRYFPRGTSSVYCFNIKGTREQAVKFCDSLKMISIVANLGDSRTIVSCPAATTHSQVPDEELAKSGIQPGTIRISVGIEALDDIIRDIEQALDAAMA